MKIAAGTAGTAMRANGRVKRGPLHAYRRRFTHDGVYYSDSEGLMAAVVDAGQLVAWLESFLRVRGLLDEELIPARGELSDRPEPAVSVQEALAALASAARVFGDAAAVVSRVWQGIDQAAQQRDACPLVRAEDEDPGDTGYFAWALVHEVLSRVAEDRAAVGRDRRATS
jgi:hypothetical protein